MHLFYDLEEAMWLAVRANFWNKIAVAARNETKTPHGTPWPRGIEWQHFRGEKCMQAVADLFLRFPDPEALVEKLILPGGELREVMDRLTYLPQLGYNREREYSVGKNRLKVLVGSSLGFDASRLSEPHHRRSSDEIFRDDFIPIFDEQRQVLWVPSTDEKASKSGQQVLDLVVESYLKGIADYLERITKMERLRWMQLLHGFEGKSETGESKIIILK